MIEAGLRVISEYILELVLFVKFKFCGEKILLNLQLKLNRVWVVWLILLPWRIFDVKITPLIVDKSQYNNQRDSFIITESGYPAKKIKQACNQAPDCPYIEFEVKSVTVSSELRIFS